MRKKERKILIGRSVIKKKKTKKEKESKER